MIDPDGLIAIIRRLAARPTGKLRCCLALSGGLDSSVLLHLLAHARTLHPHELSLRAVHVDHGLQPAARDFRREARRAARAAGVAITVTRARVAGGHGRSVEEAAREARYDVLRSVLAAGELLLTAQHADDQLETVLLALLRGAGPSGLAGMAAVAPLGRGLLVRPLLGQSRTDLESFAHAQRLGWVEDPTNVSERFDRNYLRRQVLPALRARWPAAATTVARSARHCAEAAQAEARQARRDLDSAQDGEALAAAVVRRWSPSRQRAALRAWCGKHGFRVPDERRLGEALRMLEARADASPRVAWPGAQLRLHQGRLLLMTAEISARPAVPAAQSGAAAVTAAGSPLRWDWRRQPQLVLAGIGTLAVRGDPQGDLDLSRLPAELSLRWPRSGEARPAGGSERSLRKRLQSLRVPAWARDRLPLLFESAGEAGRDRIVAIADLWLDPRFRARDDSPRRGRFVWRAED